MGVAYSLECATPINSIIRWAWRVWTVNPWNFICYSKNLDPQNLNAIWSYFHLLAVKWSDGNWKWKCSLRFRLATSVCWNIQFFLGSYEHEHESVKEWLTFHSDSNDLIPFRSFGTWIPPTRTAQFPWGYARMRCLEGEATALSARGNLYLKWVCSGYVNQSSWSPNL